MTSLYLVRTPLGCLAASIDDCGVLVFAGTIENIDDLPSIIAAVRADGAVYVAAFADQPSAIYSLRISGGGTKQIDYDEAVAARSKVLIDECGALCMRLASSAYTTWGGKAAVLRTMLHLTPIGEA
jgi:hypothetical protein